MLQAWNRNEPMESKGHDKGGNSLKPVEMTTPEQAGYLLKKLSLCERKLALQQILLRRNNVHISSRLKQIYPERPRTHTAAQKECEEKGAAGRHCHGLTAIPHAPFTLMEEKIQEL